MKNKKPVYKAAVIGCGGVGFWDEFAPRRPKPATHTGAFLNNKRIKLAAVAESDAKKRENVRRLLKGVPVFADAGKMLAETGPDIVSVATPDETHPAMVKLAVEKGVKLVICEKPIAASVAEGRKIVDICKKRNVTLLINHMRRFDPVLGKIKKDITAGKLGRIQQVRCLYGNGLFNTMTHVVDLLRWYLGEFNWAEGARINKKAASSHAGDFCVDGFLVAENGALVAFQSLNIADYGVFEIEIYGTKGAVIIRDLGFTVDFVPLRSGRYYTGRRELDIEHIRRHREKRGFFAAMVDHAVACLDGREKPLSTGEDGLAALRVLAAIRKSAGSGRKRFFI